jgi:hypothetical protein
MLKKGKIEIFHVLEDNLALYIILFDKNLNKIYLKNCLRKEWVDISKYGNSRGQN